MRTIIFFLIALAPFLGSAQSVCIAVDCKDTIFLPEDTISLNSTANGFVKVTFMGWKQITALPGILDNAGASSTVCRGLKAGTYIFSFNYVVPGGSAVLFDTVIVMNAPPPPVAHIQSVSDITLPFNQTILNGGPSFDAYGYPFTYKWSKVLGPAGDTIYNSTAAITIVKTPLPGKYVYQLTVTSVNGSNGILISFNVYAQPVSVLFTITVNGKVTTFYSDGTTK